MGIQCGEKDRCCICCDLETGIKVIGVWLGIEALFGILSIFVLTEGQITNLVMALITLSMVVCFIWSMYEKDSLKAREYWLVGMFVYFAVGVLIQVIHLIVVYI